ncbi:MAG: hypothetical protein GQ474_08040 [Sulfurimonas sp.]|nr:hypothetical protein [Sulfurimonas sp.]
MKLKRNTMMKHKELNSRYIKLLRNSKLEPEQWTCLLLSTGHKHKIHAETLVDNYDIV